MIANNVYPAKQINIKQRQNIAIQAIGNNANITNIAAANQVGRNFIYTQKNKALQGITAAFSKQDPEPLFYIPVTLGWLKAFILCLILHCRANYRGIQSLLEDCFDYSVSLGAINNLVTETASTAKKYNAEQNLKTVTLGANDDCLIISNPYVKIHIRSDTSTKIRQPLPDRSSCLISSPYSRNLLLLKLFQIKPTPCLNLRVVCCTALKNVARQTRDIFMDQSCC